MKKVFAFCCFLLMLATAGIYAQAVDINTGIRRSADHFEQQLQRSSSIAVLSVSSDSWVLSEYIINGLSSYFVNRGYFTVVDRSTLDLVQQEINFHLSGAVSDETAQAIGRIIGTETMIAGSVLPLGNEFILVLRAVSVETGVIQGMHSQNIEIDSRVAALMGGQHVPVLVSAPVSQAWYHDRLSLGFRLGGGFIPPSLNGESTPFFNIHAAFSITGQITNWFGLQTELMFSYFTWNTDSFLGTATGGTYQENRFIIPLLARLSIRQGNFSYGGFGGVYLSIPIGTMDYVGGTRWESWTARGPSVGIVLGGNFGYRIGPGVLFFDIRGLRDLGWTEYESTINNATVLSQWGGFNFSIGYEIGLFGRR